MGMFKRLHTARMLDQSDEVPTPPPAGSREAIETSILKFGPYEGWTLRAIGSRPFGFCYLYSLWLQGNKSEAPARTRRAIRDFLAGR